MRNNSKTPSQRRSQRMVALIGLLNQHGERSLAQLAEDLGASEATIRRDVSTLAARGLLVRTHGGARPATEVRELPVHLRDGRQQAEKARIAEAATALVAPGRSSIGLSGGTTAAQVLEAFAGRDDLTIITNSIAIGMAAAEQGQARVLITGGVLRTTSLELVGSLAEATLRLVNIETAFVGADGVSADSGLTAHDEIEARTNHTLIARAKRVVVVADSSKIGVTALAKMAGVQEIDVLVTDAAAPADEIERIRSAGVRVELV